MALYPDVQKKAQADIDQIALDRLPTPDDYESLPYIKAIIKEIARWGPVSPLGLPHRVAEDDVYENYLIPKGATVFGNIWYAIEHFPAFVTTVCLLLTYTGLLHMTKKCIQIHLHSTHPGTWETNHNWIHLSLPLASEGGSVLAHIWRR